MEDIFFAVHDGECNTCEVFVVHHTIKMQCIVVRIAFTFGEDAVGEVAEAAGGGSTVSLASRKRLSPNVHPANWTRIHLSPETHQRCAKTSWRERRIGQRVQVGVVGGACLFGEGNFTGVGVHRVCEAVSCYANKIDEV